MNPDLTVIRRHGRYSVLAHSQPVRLKDGTTLDLHLVQEHALPPARFLRAVLDHPLVESHIVDVRDLASCLDAEIRQLPERDGGDLVVLTLRQFYPDGAGLLTRIVEESMCKLPPADPNADCTVDAPLTPLAPADAAAVAAVMSNLRRNGMTLRQRRNAREVSNATA